MLRLAINDTVYMTDQPLVFIIIGNLIAKHREVFSRNPLFIGMRLPEARELDPLERRYPRLSSASMDIIKVYTVCYI